MVIASGVPAVHLVAARATRLLSAPGQPPAVIVVATEDFEVYHEVVTELRERDATFTTVEPGDPLPEGTTVVIVGPDDAVPDAATPRDAGGDQAGDDSRRSGSDDSRRSHGDADRPTDDPERATDDGGIPGIVARAGHPRRAVESALALARGETGRTVVGVDPGTRPGVAVLSGDVVVAAYQVPLADVPDVVREAVADAVDPVVRVGDGARLLGRRIIEALDEVRVELVDETGTTPTLGTGARGMGDVLAAVNIARRSGEAVERRPVEPTRGELQVIQERSREASAGNRAIDEALARRVAAGELTIEEALAEHRGDG